MMSLSFPFSKLKYAAKIRCVRAGIGQPTLAWIASVSGSEFQHDPGRQTGVVFGSK
jgi:hypothetical protein